MYAINHHVDVCARAVVVCDEERLVLGQAKPAKQAISHILHLVTRWLVADIEGDHDVVARSLDAHTLVRGCFHNDRRESQVDDHQTATCDPFNALGMTPISPGSQIGS